MSPTLLSQRVTVPSVTDSPRAGRITGVSVPGRAWLPERGGLGSGGSVPSAAAAAAAAGATVGCGGTAVTAGAGAGAVTAAGAGAGAASGAAGAAAAAGAGAAPGSPITPSGAPTGTVSSSPASIDSRTPDAGAGISVSTLSVETSSSGSSARISSPTCLSQRVTVPSVTLSPSCGMVTVTDICGCAPIDSTVRGQACACSGLPASARCASPSASFWVGWACTRAATSPGWASQL